MQTPKNKMVDLDIEGYQGSCDDLLELFSKKALQEGWSTKEIQSVINEATKHNDFVHLVETIREYCKY
jgi:sugar diacid utilization regulator